MAITPLTGFKAFTFDGETSTDYGVQILGEGVFNAPEREVEMINIPGRNGAFALDKGRFENIDVKYPANIIADSTEDFAEAVSDLRNFLCSRKGYCRLTDGYHPDEYRMAVYREGLEVDERVLRAGDFDIVFDCMPQRYLTSGEEAITVADGQTITNPTLFASSPMLEVEGYGNININGYALTRNNTTLGNIQLLNWRPAVTFDQTYSFTFDKAKLNEGDTIYFSANANWGGFFFTVSVSYAGATSYSASNSNTDAISTRPGDFYYESPVEFIVGTPKTITNTQTITATIVNVGTDTATWTGGLSYDGDCTFTVSISLTPSEYINPYGPKIWQGTLYGNSTLSTFGTVYIDCDLGEAYTVIDGSPVSANGIVSMGADLPTLASGANEISFDNTITSLKITPRWWKV